MSETKIEDFRQDSAGNWKLSVNAQAAAERLRDMCDAAFDDVHHVPSVITAEIWELREQCDNVIRKFGTIDDKRESFAEKQA